MKKLLFLIMNISTVLLSFAMEKELKRYVLEKFNQVYEDQELQLSEQEKFLQQYVKDQPYVNRNNLFKYFRKTECILMEAIVKKDISEMRNVIESTSRDLRPILVNSFIEVKGFLEVRGMGCLMGYSYMRGYPPTCPYHIEEKQLKGDLLMMNPLREAIMVKDEKILQALFECGTSIDVNKGFPLRIAITFNVKAIPFLLQKGVKENIDEALYYAVAIENIDAAKELLKAGASLNSRDSKSHLTPLQLACVQCGSLFEEYWDDNMVKFFLEQGAFIDEADSNGRTLLHRVAEDELGYIAYFLLEHGANVLAKDKAGRTVIECIPSKSFDARSGLWFLSWGAPYPITAFHREIMEDRSAEPNKNISYELQNSSEFFKNYLKALIKDDTEEALTAIAQASANDIKKAGPFDDLRPLHWAVVRNNHKVVEALVVNSTTLQALVPQLPPIIMSLVKNRRININCRDGSGRTPLMLAARLGYTHIYRILKKARADVTLVDEKGKMALNYAADYRNVNIIREMIIDGTLSVKPGTNQN